MWGFSCTFLQGKVISCATGGPVVELSVPAGRLAVVLAVVGVSITGSAVGPEMIIFCLSWAPAECYVMSHPMAVVAFFTCCRAFVPRLIVSAFGALGVV